MGLIFFMFKVLFIATLSRPTYCSDRRMRLSQISELWQARLSLSKPQLARFWALYGMLRQSISSDDRLIRLLMFIPSGVWRTRFIAIGKPSMNMIIGQN